METQTTAEPIAPQKSHLPKVNNKTQAQQLAQALFGPLVRIRKDAQGVQVYIQNRSNSLRLGIGADFQLALEDAYQYTVGIYKAGNIIEGVIPAVPKRNIVEDKRRELIIKLPDVKDVDVINSLHPNEVLEVIELVQLRDYKAVEPFIEKAAVRNEHRKAEIAKLMKEAEKLKAAMEAAAQDNKGEDAVLGHTEPDKQLFDVVQTEDKTFVVEPGTLTKEMIEEACKR